MNAMNVMMNEKPGTKEHMLYDSIHTEFPDRQTDQQV